MGAAPHSEPDTRPPVPGDGSRPPPSVLLQMTQACLWVCAAACFISTGLLIATLNDHVAGGAPAALFGVLTLAAGAATQLPARWLGSGLTAVLMGITLAVAFTTLSLGWGLSAPGLPVSGLMVCVLCAAAGWRAGTALALVAMVAVLAVAAASDTPSAPRLPTAPLLLGTHLLAIASGLATGTMISQVMARYMRRARDRAWRFRRLLALAADVYWETDAALKLVAASNQGGELQPLSVERGLGRTPWSLPQFHCEPQVLERLRAEMAARRPFRDVPVGWTSTTDGQLQAYLASGEPRFDAHGVFTGYWGVARNVTQEQAARDALAATETRYLELFSRIPTPLVLHRDGLVIDANPAALALFGHADLSSLAGSDLLAAYESGDSRERARRRMDQLQGQPPGTALPVTSFRLVVGGRRVSVRATSVRVMAEGGPALLAFFIDDTERLAAEEAVRRSETMLSHLVATSPDLITLTELATGRYVMINQSFERFSGYSAAEVVGRTSLELGLWGSPDDRAAFVARLREQGQVSDLPVTFVTKGGHPVAMVGSAARFVMDERDYMVINARDVSERERQRLEREAILANASIGIAVTREQRFVLANRHFEQIYGWGPGEMVGQPGRVVWVNDEDYAEIGRLLGPALARGEAAETEREARRKDGSRFLARVRGRAIDPQRPAEGGTVWIIEDITERRQSELALARARDDAEAASRAKSAFLANTSHELRTPLNGMIGLARLASDPATPAERRGPYLDQIVESAQSLAGIISDILDLSKIEAGKLQLENTGFDLLALLQTLQRHYATLAVAHGLTLQLEAQAGLQGAVSGDPLRVRQIVSNFLSNAIKFTPRGSVVLRAERLAEGGLVRLLVQDSGVGIDQATRARLFQPFTQADQSTTRRFGGTGLGLSICQELATLMGGRVGVDSTPGEGSRFWVDLPLPAAEPVPATLAPGPDAAAALAGLRVLMVEDNAVNMLIAAALLERWGVVVTQAVDGRQAVAAVAQAAAAGRPYDAVLMDVQMPVMSGHEATRELRRQGQRLPVIALTAAALVTERETALAAGMDDFLTKPIDADKLQATLLRWCRRGAFST